MYARSAALCCVVGRPDGRAGIRAQALYPYTPSSDGELAVKGGDVLDIIENDGSGWLHVIHADGREGYVPQSYVQML